MSGTTALLEGKVAVIAGAASGMGLATARRFLAEGAQVVVADFNADAGGISAAGTRLFGRLNGTTNLDRLAGIAHGTTGRRPTVRHLD